MINKIPYQSISVLLFIFFVSFFLLPYKIIAQETGGKKLEVSEKKSPEKMDNKKVKTSKRRKAKGNPNKGSNKVIVINPFNWDWDKVMWFKAKKSDYETKDYNPDKRPKRKTYDNNSKIRSTDRKAITNPSELKKPLIPYDSRVADEGPVLQKKRKPEKIDMSDAGPDYTPTGISLFNPKETLSKAPKKERESKVEGKKLYSRRKDKERKPFDNDKLETALAPDLDPKMDEDKIMYKKRKNDYSKMNNDKLMTDRPANPERKKYDEDKLMTASVNKPKKQDLHDDRLLTVVEKRKPTDEMKQTSKDISNLEGDYKRHFYISNNSHPGTKILAAENTKLPFLARTFQSVSSFFTSIWKDNTQPGYVTDKKPKERRDKNEGKIWDNSVHPDEWKKQEAESGEQQ